MTGPFKKIEDEAFLNCQSLEKLIISDSDKINSFTINAFKGCNNLKKFECSEKLKNIFRRHLKIDKWQVVRSWDYSQFPNIISLYIPYSTIIVDPEKFIKLFTNLKTIKCRAEYLQYVENKDNVKMLIFHKQEKEIDLSVLKQFTGVELLYLQLLLELNKTENTFSDL